MAGRSALDLLVEAAKRKPRPFDRILVDDTSRLARNTADFLRLVAILRFHEVHVTAVSQGIDTQQKSTRPLLAVQGMMDEQYLVGLAEKVHRGQEGRVLKGLIPGGRCYGYMNVPIEDPSRQGKYGRPAVSGVRLELHPEQARLVRRIFEMYASGGSLAGIAKTLNAEGVRSPQPGRKSARRAWCPTGIREMLRRERYRGVHVWNRTRKERNPETGRKVSRARPESDYVRAEVPGWRIVSEELWEAVQQRIVEKQRFGNARLGGLDRTEKSRRYLFSGLLECGECQARMVIVSGRGRQKRGYPRYGCPSHRYRGSCHNGLTIRQERLEEQLLGALEERLLKPEMMDYTLRRFREQLDQRLAEIQRDATRNSLPALQRKHKELQEQAERLADAIGEAGHSPTLLSRLTRVESELARVEESMQAHKPFNPKGTEEEIRDFVTKNVLHLRHTLRGDVTAAKAALQTHMGQLILTPKGTQKGPVFEVSGAIDLLGSKDVMLMVARDGIEPPTPAFSEPRSTIAKLLILFAIFIAILPKTTNLLEQKWNSLLEQPLVHKCLRG